MKVYIVMNNFGVVEKVLKDMDKAREVIKKVCEDVRKDVSFFNGSDEITWVSPDEFYCDYGAFGERLCWKILAFDVEE